MKSKEEVEKLAFLKYPRLINDPYNPMEDDNDYERQIYIEGYTQCQEDMADELKALEVYRRYNQSIEHKEYTEQDVIRLMFNATKWDTFKEGEVGYDMSLREYIQHCLQILNKQD